MSSFKISERILEGVKANSEGDKIIESFLINLIYEEAEHSGQWRWKEIYNKHVDTYSDEWEGGNAN